MLHSGQSSHSVPERDGCEINLYQKGMGTLGRTGLYPRKDWADTVWLSTNCSGSQRSLAFRDNFACTESQKNKMCRRGCKIQFAELLTTVGSS